MQVDKRESQPREVLLDRHQQVKETGALEEADGVDFVRLGAGVAEDGGELGHGGGRARYLL